MRARSLCRAAASAVGATAFCEHFALTTTCVLLSPHNMHVHAMRDYVNVNPCMCIGQGAHAPYRRSRRHMHLTGVSATPVRCMCPLSNAIIGVVVWNKRRFPQGISVDSTLILGAMCSMLVWCLLSLHVALCMMYCWYIVVCPTRGLGYTWYWRPREGLIICWKWYLKTVHARTDTKKLYKKLRSHAGWWDCFACSSSMAVGLRNQPLKWNTGPSSLHLWNWDVPVLFMQKMECSLQQSGGQPRSQVAETWVAISYLTTHACGTVYRTVSSSHVALSNHKPLLTLVCLGGLFSISRENKRTIGRPKIN